MNRAYHLTPAERWAAADPAEPYGAPSLEDEGFVHLTHTEPELVAAANRHYTADPRPFLVLEIDLDRLTVPWRYDKEPPDTRFPHAYGPLDRAAILAVHRYDRAPDGTFLGIGERR